MRIAHVVTYISPDGAFGGPVRVALGQAEALASLGHDVTVYAAAPPPVDSPQTRDGYTLKTFPARRLAPFGGFAALSARGLLRELRKDAPAYDLAHVHLARDLVTVPAALALRRARVPYVLQPHGMIDVSSRVLAKPLDLFAVKPLLRDAGSVLTLTEQEMRDIAEVEPEAATQRIPNGIRVGELRSYDDRDNVVLFLARLAPRKRPLAFVEMARRLGGLFPETRFVLAGPDEGEGEAVLRAIAEAQMGDRLEWIGAVSPDETDELLASSRVYVLPAFNEVFPMSILESLRAGTPVVTTDSLGIAGECERFGAAAITDGSPEDLARAVAAVLESADEAARLRSGGLRYLREELDIEGVATRLEAIYTRQLT